jgi:hypothetical protein
LFLQYYGPQDGEDKLKDIMEYKDETLPKLDEVIGTHEVHT